MKNIDAAILVLGEKGLMALKHLDTGFSELISSVIIGEDGNISNDYSNEIIELCKSRGINYQLKSSKIELKNDILIAIGWRWMVRKNKNQKLFIFHDSILPKYRGFNPLVTALINGDQKIGITCLQGSEKYDCGDIISVKEISIQYPIKIKEAIYLTSIAASDLLKDLLSSLFNGVEIKGIKQNDNQATYSLWRDEKDYFINWNLPAEEIKRFINAVGYPYLGARTLMDNQQIIIEEAEVVTGYNIENLGIGKVLFKEDGLPVVACGKDLLKIINIKNLDGEPVEFPSKFRVRFK